MERQVVLYILKDLISLGFRSENTKIGIPKTLIHKDIFQVINTTFISL